MKIEQLPSGSYRIRKMYKGHMYSVTFDEKPTQKEALQAIADELDKVAASEKHLTFEGAAQKYIASKENILSPKTVREYTSTIKRLPSWWNALLLSDISQLDINKLVNEMSKDKSPKTVRNYHGFVTAVLGTFRPQLRIYTSLPKSRQNEPYIPSTEDIKKILEAVKDTEYEIPVILGCYGMRRSEICALTVDDIEGDVVHINKALVQDKNNKWVVKNTNKTEKSTRDIIIAMDVADKIRENGYVYKGFPGNITKRLKYIEAQMGMEPFSLHKLRHYFASQCSALGIPEADILHLGGWKSDHVMKTVYRHSMLQHDKESKRKAVQTLSDSLFS